MPAAAVYVAAVVGAAAAGYAFKEFVYEPHLAPILKQWAEDMQARRQERRRRMQRAAPVSVPTNPFSDDAPTSRGPAAPVGSASGVNGDDARWRQSVVELQNLAERERSEWAGGDRDGLRRRHGGQTDQSVSSLPLGSLDHSEQHWQNSRPEMEDLISLSRSSTITMPNPRTLPASSPSATLSSATLSSVSRSISPEVAVATPPRSLPTLHASPRSQFVDVPGDDFNLSDWTPASPGFSASGSNLADSFANLDAPTPIAVAPPRSDAASPFVVRDDASVTSGSEDVTYDGTDVSLGSDDDLSDLVSNDGSDVSGWQSVSRDP